MKKKILLFSALAGFLAVTLLVGTSAKGLPLIRATAAEYTLTFDADTNDYASIGASGLTATTKNGASVAVAVSDLADVTAYEEGAFTIAAGGFIENKDPIHGITAVTAYTAGGEALKLHLGYDGKTYLETVILDGAGDAFEFDHTQPNYLRFENDTEAPISIDSITIEYSCTPQANIYEILGSHNGWSAGHGDTLYYNYSYENISYEDQWMIKGLTLELGTEFKIHGNSEWYGTEILSTSSGSAVAAGQLGGSGNIEVLANSMTADIYFKYNRNTTEFSAWIGADPDAVVETPDVETYNVYVVVEGWTKAYAHMWIDGGAGTSWPGTACKPYEGKENTWYIEVPVDKGYEKIIFNNNSGTQTVNLDMPAIDDEKNCFYFDVKQWGTLTNKPDDIVPVPYTIYYKNTQNWSNVNVYVWNSAGNNGWPGDPMTQIDSVNNIWSIELDKNDEWVNIIFNGTGGQTDDLVIPTDAKNYYNGSSWTTYGA